MANQNIAISVSEEDFREAQALAARRGVSVSQLLARMLSDLVRQETGYAGARERSLARLREGVNLGIDGRISWSRNNIQEQ